MPFRYQGQYEDEETGLYYNRFRYYDCISGTFICQDPIGLSGKNPTMYALVSDTNLQIDPYGLAVENGLNVIFTTAEATNATFPSGYEPPYKPGTKVTEFTTINEHTFVRVHGVNNKVGGWVMSESAVRGLSPVELKEKYSLPELPTHISKVTVPGGTRMRSGRVNPIFGGSDINAKQFQLLERIPVDNYGKSKFIKCK